MNKIVRHGPLSDQEAAAYLGCTAEALKILLDGYPVPRYPSGPEKGKLMANSFFDIAERIVEASLRGRTDVRRPEITQEQIARATARGGCGG